MGIFDSIRAKAVQTHHVISSGTAMHPSQQIERLPEAPAGGFPLSVVGEGHYQESLERICGGRSEMGHSLEVDVVLIHEPDNPHDKNAIRVAVSGMTVGYLAKEHAEAYRPALVARGNRATCRGQIRGGWDRGPRDQGHFGISLDVAPPSDC